MIFMSSIQGGGNLLSSIYQKTQQNQVTRSQPTEEIKSARKTAEEEVSPEQKPIVSEELSFDRYETSMGEGNEELAAASDKQTEQLNQSTAYEVGGVGERTVATPAAAAELDHQPVTAEAETVASVAASAMNKAEISTPELQVKILEREQNPNPVQSANQRAKMADVQTEAPEQPAPPTEHDSYKSNATHTQNSMELSKTEELQDITPTDLPVADVENLIPDMPTPEETARQPETIETVADTKPRNSTQWDTPVQQQVAENYIEEVNSELQAKTKARATMLADIPTEPIPSEQVEVQSVVEPVYDRDVMKQSIETGPQPTVASVKTDGVIDEAVAVPKSMLEHYAPAEIDTQPTVEIEENKSLEPPPTELPAQHTQATAKEQSEHAPIEEPIEIEDIELPVPEIVQWESPVAESPTVQATRDISATQIEDEVEINVADYFPPLPGSGETVTETQETNTPLAGSGDISTRADEFFAPLPGSGETSVANPEEFFAPLPGSGEYDGSQELFEAQPMDEFLEENPIFGHGKAESEEFDLAAIMNGDESDHSSTISAEQLAYMQTGVSNTQFNMLEEQFGTNADVNDYEYDPFSVQNEEWVQDALNFELGSRYFVNSQVGEANPDLTIFEETEPTEEEIQAQSVEMREFLDHQLDRVTDFELSVEPSQKEIEMEDIFNAK